MKITLYIAKRKNMCDGRLWTYHYTKKVSLADGACEPCSAWPNAESAEHNLRAAGLDSKDYELIELNGEAPDNAVS